MKTIKGLSVLSAAIMLAACGGKDNDDNNSQASSLNVPATYSFESKLQGHSGDSSVATSGQITRHLLISELKTYIGSEQLQIETVKEDALNKLKRIFAVGTTDDANNLKTTNLYTDGVAATVISTLKDSDKDQTTFADVSGDKKLVNKMAGQDNDMTHDEFVGWDSLIIPTGDNSKKKEGINNGPKLLMEQWLGQLADLAVDGDASTQYVTATGLDLQQLTQKFLLTSITYSQAAEDYLKADKGLLKQNTEADKKDKPYTSLEHAWDEGFGYFGAARDYNNYSDSETKKNPAHDSNKDGNIDLYSEYSFGNSINAVKRDKGSAGNAAATDYSKAAMDAFLKGRAIISANVGTDPVKGEGYHVQLVEQATIALNNWEKAVAATVVHYINDVNADMAVIGTAAYDDAKQAKHLTHWGEMKGFALGLQFSPSALISLDQLKVVHAAMGEAPIQDEAGVAAYTAKLTAARDVLQAAYGFDADNVANW